MIRMMTVFAASAGLFATVSANAGSITPAPVPLGAANTSPPRAAEQGHHSCRCETITKLRLVVWSSVTCIPCRQFWRDFEIDPAFRAAILSRFHVQRADVDAHRTAAAARGIASVPTFDLVDRQITGYQGKQWLWRELTALAGNAPSSPTSAAEPVPDSSAPATDASLAPLPPLPRAKNSHASEQTTAADSSPKRTVPPPQSLFPFQRPVDSRPDQTGRRRLWSQWGEWMHRSVPLVLTGLEVAGILGGSAATGGLGTIALAALWKLWQRKRRGRQSRTRGSIRRESAQTSREEESAMPPAPFPRRLDEARELLALRQSEGRVATLDALRGMFLDDELNKLAASSGETEAAVAEKLKAAIDRRVDEVAPLSTTID